MEYKPMRELLRTVTVACAFSTASVHFSAMEAWAKDPPTVTHGPMLGHPSSDSIRVWARTSEPSTFDVRYGITAGRFDHSVTAAATELAHDNTGTVELTNLEADTRYWYQVYINEWPQMTAGTFRTLPNSKALREPTLNPRGLFNFRFAIGSCANQNPQHGIGHALPLYQTMRKSLQDNISFAIMNGDWLYEELRDTPVSVWASNQRIATDAIPRVVDTMPTIVGVWENYKLYLSRGVPLANWHRNMPSLFTFDDHELVNDIWGAGSAGRRHRRAVFRDIGTRAWDDYLSWANPKQYHHPVHFGKAHFTAGSNELVDPSANFESMPLHEMANLHVHWGTPTAGVNEIALDDDNGHPNSRVYDIADVINKTTLRLHMPAKVTGEAAYSIGRRNYGKYRVANCEFYLLDTRSHRQMHDVRNPSQPGLTMLGHAQRNWLLQNMRRSDADFFFVVSSVPMMIPHSGAGGFEFDSQNKEEAWVAFLDEREALIDAWDNLNKPVCVMTGDLHNSFAIKITDRVWEFCCGPHNSVNHVPELDEGDRPVTGPFQSGPRAVDIRWSSYLLPDIPRLQRLYPYYCVVQVNNVFNTPLRVGDTRWMAYQHPQIILQYFHGRSGKLAYSESISMPR